MQKFLLIGGTAPASTGDYYSMIDKIVKQKQGGNHSLRMALESLEFHCIEQLIESHDIDALYQIYAEILQSYRGTICGYALLSNTTNALLGQRLCKEFPDLELVGISDPTVARIRKMRVSRIAFLGTSVAANSPELLEPYVEAGIEVFYPNYNDQSWLNDLIFQRLTPGYPPTAGEESRFYDLIESLQAHHDITGFVLGCTELRKICTEDEYAEMKYDLHLRKTKSLTELGYNAPIRFDTTAIHSEAIVDHYLKHLTKPV